MNLAHLPQKIEITFWAAAVAVMKNRRLFQMLLLVGVAAAGILALSFLSIGLQRELLTRTLLEVRLPASQNSQTKTGQLNVLILVVDRLDYEQTKLRGSWLVTALPTLSKLTFLPLYPSVFQGASTLDGEIASRFALDARGGLSEDFKQSLQNQDLWWDTYVILDEVALEKIADQVGGVNMGEGVLTGNQAVEMLNLSQSQTGSMLFEQSAFARDLCRRSALILYSNEPGELFSELAGHFVTDANPGVISQGWYRHRSEQTWFSCEFPILPEVSPLAYQP